MKKMGHLVLMVKEPRMGRVKTRLADEIGVINAWRFFKLNVARTANTLRDKRWHCWLSITPDTATNERGIWPRGWKRIKQGNGDLGVRMLAPMKSLPPGPVVIIGSDVPGITKAHINTAFRALGANDMAIGPATDGGYWLVGQRRRPITINPFKNARWSTPHALDDTLADALASPRRIRISLLDILSDVDTAKDYAEWKKKR
ncbi:MAG: TIGR04282 family arsenosugar biosynthesis glycosyltransferase [Rhodospirillaceae bacterium]|nr:TIGR04282 family arsenosugar biosynthesis glycosyltransferase [Rhodospirillaceae bacterium]